MIPLPAILKTAPCPCGCPKVIVTPLFHHAEASLYKEEADELVKRWNAYEELTRALKLLGKGGLIP